MKSIVHFGLGLAAVFVGWNVVQKIAPPPPPPKGKVDGSVTRASSDPATSPGVFDLDSPIPRPDRVVLDFIRPAAPIEQTQEIQHMTGDPYSGMPYVMPGPDGGGF